MRTEDVVRVRGGARVTLRLFSPAQPRKRDDVDLILSAYRLYMHEGADVVVNDVIEVRGVAHRVCEFPEGRTGAALVVDVEQAAAGASAFDSAVSIAPRSTTAAFNPTSGQTEAVPSTPVYVGPAQIDTRPASDGRNSDVGGDLVNGRVYTVSLPAGVGDAVNVDDVITVTAATNADLVGRRLHVESVARPGREAGHELSARLFD